MISLAMRFVLQVTVFVVVFLFVSCNVTSVLEGPNAATLNASTNNGSGSEDDNEGESNEEETLQVESNLPSGTSLTGSQIKWRPVKLCFSGPNVNESDSPSPFLQYRLIVRFTGPAARNYDVPGFFAADDNAAETHATSGDQWCAYFTADEVGLWTFQASFRMGTNVAIDLALGAGQPTSFDGAAGSFTIVDFPNDGDPRNKGRVVYTGERYLRYAETGEPFIKVGADSPENFLGYFEFDQTSDQGGLAEKFNETQSPYFGDDLHHYQWHEGDYNTGDPSWDREADGQRAGRGIIGAINYLASTGMNNIYFVTYNLDGGDGRDTWPWTSTSERHRFDVSKLAQWEIVFDHMDRKGISLHVVTQEAENDATLSGGSLGLDRKLYYRELVARFGHHLNVNWNLGEEFSISSTSADQDLILEFAEHIKALDPYNHRVVVHTYPGSITAIYSGIIGEQDFNGASIQWGGSLSNDEAFEETLEWINRSQCKPTPSWNPPGSCVIHPWIVTIDEIGPASTGVPEAFTTSDLTNTHHNIRKNIIWGNLMAGGAGVEHYFGYDELHNDINAEDWRSRAPVWDQTRYAAEFFRNYLPFDEMENCNGFGSGNLDLVSSGNNFCLAKPGDTYALYFKNGGSTSLDLESSTSTYEVQRYNPRTGTFTGSPTMVTGPGQVSISSPSGDDWAMLIKKL